MDTILHAGPFLNACVNFAATVIIAVATPYVVALGRKIDETLNLKGNATARAALDGVLEDAVHFAAAAAMPAFTRVGNIDVRNPQIAAAGNFVLNHAPQELAQLGFGEQHVVDLVRSTLQQKSTEKIS